jgi:hypothetical protein
VNFYQTLAKASAPYVIETSTIDPFNQTLSNPQGLSEGTIDSGTYVASGETVNIVSAAPVEIAGHYTVAASAPNYGDGPLTTTVGPPKAGNASVPLAGLSLARREPRRGAVAVSLACRAIRAAAGVARACWSPPGRLDTVLSKGGGTVAATVPASTPSSHYYLGAGLNCNNQQTPCRSSPFRPRSTCSSSTRPVRSTERHPKSVNQWFLRPSAGAAVTDGGVSPKLHTSHRAGSRQTSPGFRN